MREKPKLIALNKSDLADEKVSREWMNWYNLRGYANVFIDSIKGRGINELKGKYMQLWRKGSKGIRKGAGYSGQ